MVAELFLLGSPWKCVYPSYLLFFWLTVCNGSQIDSFRIKIFQLRHWVYRNGIKVKLGYVVTIHCVPNYYASATFWLISKNNV